MRAFLLVAPLLLAGCGGNDLGCALSRVLGNESDRARDCGQHAIVLHHTFHLDWWTPQPVMPRDAVGPPP